MSSSKDAPDSEKVINIQKADLPLHCPTGEQSAWSMHPKVFLPIDQDGKASCPYCGTRYNILTN